MKIIKIDRQKKTKVNNSKMYPKYRTTHILKTSLYNYTYTFCLFQWYVWR